MISCDEIVVSTEIFIFLKDIINGIAIYLQDITAFVMLLNIRYVILLNMLLQV